MPRTNDAAVTERSSASRGLARRLGAFDAMLIVMGGVVGSGIFMTPSVVAQRVHSAPLILAAWILGGIVALIGAFVFAELAWRRPASGGLYGYLRDAYHPVIAFAYGWTALLISQSGGMAAAAITFGAYVGPALPGGPRPTALAVAAIAILTAINCFGVREGSNTQNLLMILKAATIVAVIIAGAAFVPHVSAVPLHSNGPQPSLSLAVVGFGAAMIPVLFAYDGFQTAAFIDGELNDPQRTLPRGLVWGIAGVVVLYVAMAFVALRGLGAAGLAATTTPASDVMALAFGTTGQRIVAFGVALSTLGFLSNQILTSPRIYYAMAEDGAFFKIVAWLHPRSRAPIVAIALQGAVAIVIALSGRYDQILNYVTSIDFVFLGLAAGAIIVFRRRQRSTSASGITVPGHPWTTIAFIVISVAVIVDTLISFPTDTLIGLALLVLSVPAYYAWKRKATKL